MDEGYEVGSCKNYVNPFAKEGDTNNANAEYEKFKKEMEKENSKK